MSEPQKQYWRSLEELSDTPEFRKFVEAEFPGLKEQWSNPVTRRRFLKVMGASFALAGLAGCTWPEETIVPFSSRPEGYTPGKTKQFATAMEIAGAAQGLLVTSFDGRPIKVEGNPQHPINQGATDVFARASILGLYDPDRSHRVIRREGVQELKQSWNDFLNFARPLMDRKIQNGGADVFIIAEQSSSPTFHRLRHKFLETLPNARWYVHEPLSRNNEREGTRLVFGEAYRPQYAIDKAKLILCFDDDLLYSHPAWVKHARDFASGRTAEDGSMNRLYAVESVLSITGSMADKRWAIRSREIPAVIAALGQEILKTSDTGSATQDRWKPLMLEQLAGKADPAVPVAEIAAELTGHPGETLITVGPGQPAVVHDLVHTINHALDNNGKTVNYIAEQAVDFGTSDNDLTAFAADFQSLPNKSESVVVILGANPTYSAPRTIDFAGLLGETGTSIHLSLYDDETSMLCDWHLPQAHYLESWGDARARDGTLSLVQPLIAPLYGGKTSAELLAHLLGEPTPGGHDIVRDTMREIFGGNNFETQWRKALHDGVVEGATLATEPVDLQPAAAPERLQRMLEEATGTSDSLELVLIADGSVYDGRFANNGWLQELPDAVSKLTWDNAAILSLATANDLGVKTGDVVSLTVAGKTIDAPVYIQPGQADGSIALSLGYGRTRAGTVATGVGVNAYTLQTSPGPQYYPVKITRTGRTHTLVSTQDHHAIDTRGMQERESRIHELIREAELSEFKENPHFASAHEHHPPLKSLWDEHEYTGHRWAMAIDLSVCTGCNACVLACQSENNTPVVGKENVAEGREMHWIRIDRYFSGPPEEPKVSFQPVTCHHCENAPCEQVCPVGATVHDDEGLNVMVYNRCVGTRYCSNNCPYKVRRFNFFEYHKNLSVTEKMMYNPDVTVRGRGVMEKCTFCIQRINAVKIEAQNKRQPIEDGQIVPACAQACPTKAIVFGDLSDPDSRVSQAHQDPRSYAILKELNVKPRTKYLARLRNSGETTQTSDDHG